jgi:hypothetical protein
MELQFYLPGWVAAAGIGCDATHWCSALNIDTFQTNPNTGDSQQRGLPEHGRDRSRSTRLPYKERQRDGPPGNRCTRRIFVPSLGRDYLMNSGDVIRLHMSDSASGFRVMLDDVTRHTHGSMTASAANGFGSVLFQPHATHVTCSSTTTTRCTARRRRPAATSTQPIPATSFADEIGHFEYCAAVRNDALGTCDRPLGDDTNDPDNAGPDPQETMSLPAGSASTLIKIGGCLNTDGDSTACPTSSPGPAQSPTRPPTGC